MSNNAWICAVLLIVGVGQSGAQPTAKITTISQVNVLTGQLLNVAKQRVADGGEPDSKSLSREIDRLFENERDPDVLARVALISNIYLQPGLAGDQTFDEVFEVGWGACIRRIERIGGQPAIDALEYIDQNMHLDGSFSLSWKDAMQRLKAKQAKSAARSQ